MERPKIPFAQIKRDVAVVDVARRHGIELKPNGNDEWLHGECKLRSHESKKSKTSFSVNIRSNFFVCHSRSCQQNRAGKTGGDVITLAYWLGNHTDYYSAAKSLMDDFRVVADGNGNGAHAPATPAPSPKPEPQKAEASVVNAPLKFQAGFKELDYAHEYLKKRGIRPETAKAFGVGFYAGKSSVIKDPYRIVIPIHNSQGELVAYIGRSLDPELKDKYHFPSGFRKTMELFNLHRVTDDTAILVEGFFGTLKVAQAGIPNVIGLMGRTLSETQENLLARFKRLILMLDPDEPGREAQAAIAPRLAANHYIRAVNLPDGKQPDSLSSMELYKILAPIL